MSNLCREGQRPNYHETDEGLIPVFRKLRSQGITEEDEDKLLFLRDIILKLHRAKSRCSIKNRQSMTACSLLRLLLLVYVLNHVGREEVTKQQFSVKFSEEYSVSGEVSY